MIHYNITIIDIHERSNNLILRVSAVQLALEMAFIDTSSSAFTPIKHEHIRLYYIIIAVHHVPMPSKNICSMKQLIRVLFTASK